MHAVELGEEGEEMKLALFAQYLEAEQQEDFEGSFQDFLHAIDRDDLVEVSGQSMCARVLARAQTHTHTCTHTHTHTCTP